MSLDTLPLDGTFAPDLPHAGPGDAPCRVGSGCPRPAAGVWLMLGKRRISCAVHGADLRRQGATLTDIDPSRPEPPEVHPARPAEIVSAPAVVAQAPRSAESPASSVAGDCGIQPLEAPVSDPIPCSWPGCGKPRTKRLFCHTCQGRAQAVTGSAKVPPDQIAGLPALWAARLIDTTGRRRANPPPKRAAPAPTPADPPQTTAPAPIVAPVPAPAMFGGKWARAMESSTDQLAARRALTDRLALGERADDRVVDAAVRDLILEARRYVRERGQFAAEAESLASDLAALDDALGLPGGRETVNAARLGRIEGIRGFHDAELAEARNAAAVLLDELKALRARNENAGSPVVALPLSDRDRRLADLLIGSLETAAGDGGLGKTLAALRLLVCGG